MFLFLFSSSYHTLDDQTFIESQKFHQNVYHFKSIHSPRLTHPNTHTQMYSYLPLKIFKIIRFTCSWKNSWQSHVPFMQFASVSSFLCNSISLLKPGNWISTMLLCTVKKKKICFSRPSLLLRSHWLFTKSTSSHTSPLCKPRLVDSVRCLGLSLSWFKFGSTYFTDQRFGYGLRGQFITAHLDHSISAMGSQTWLYLAQVREHEGGVWGLLKAPLTPRKFTASAKEDSENWELDPWASQAQLPLWCALSSGCLHHGCFREDYTSYLSAQSSQHMGETKRERDTTASLWPSLRSRGLKSTIFYLSG